MKAISIWQPWASLIAHGHKTIETRTHDKFRFLVGERIAIHASKRKMTEDERIEFHWMLRDFKLAVMFDIDALPLGCVVATARVFSFIDRDDKAWKSSAFELTARIKSLCVGPFYGLGLSEIRLLETPIPFKGAQGVFHVPDSLIPETAR